MCINLIDKHIDKCYIYEVSDHEVKCSITLGDMLISWKLPVSNDRFVVERFLIFELYWKLRVTDNLDELSLK